MELSSPRLKKLLIFQEAIFQAQNIFREMELSIPKL